MIFVLETKIFVHFVPLLFTGNMLILKELSLINFLSHANTIIKFGDNCKTLVDGISGSGKSSLVDALVFGLYGEGRCDKKNLIRKGSVRAEVSVILEETKDNVKTKYKVTRIITNKNKHEFEILEKTGDTEYAPIKALGVKDSQDYLENKILNSSYLLFINSVIFPQDNPESFLKQTASKRKDIILEMVRVKDHDTYYKKAQELFRDTKSELEMTQFKIDEKKKTIDEKKPLALKVDEYENQHNANNKLAEELQATQADFERRIKEIDTIISFVTQKRGEVNTLDDRINKNNTEIAELKTNIANLENIDFVTLRNRVALYNAKYQELGVAENARGAFFSWSTTRTKLIMEENPGEIDYNPLIEDLNKKGIALLKEPVESCLKCGEPYPKMEEYRKRRLDEINKEMAEKIKAKEEFAELKKIYLEKLTALGDAPVFDEALIKKLKEDILELSSAEVELAKAEASAERIKQIKEQVIRLEADNFGLIDSRSKAQGIVSMNNLEKLNSDKNVLGNEQFEISKKKMELDGTLLVSYSLLSNARDAVVIVEKTYKDLEELEGALVKKKEDVEALELVKETFGQNGLRVMIIDFIIPRLEEKINEILGQLSDFTVRLETQKTGLGKDVILDGLFINLIDGNGNEMEFGSFSGGERVKISIAIFEALASISKCKFRCLDESIVSLDSESTSSFVEALRYIQENVKQLICISHLQEIQNLFEDRINIRKINGISQIFK